MNPEERTLLERSLTLSEENNRLLKKIERRAHWALVWWFIKVAIVIVPLVAGYLYLQPYIDQALENYKSIQSTLNL